MTESPDLLPCPFCGKDALIHEEDGTWWGCCCHCDSEGAFKSSKDEAIAAWNRRAPASVPASGADLLTAEEREYFMGWKKLHLRGDAIVGVMFGALDRIVTAHDAQAAAERELDGPVNEAWLRSIGFEPSEDTLLQLEIRKIDKYKSPVAVEVGDFSGIGKGLQLKVSMGWDSSTKYTRRQVLRLIEALRGE